MTFRYDPAAPALWGKSKRNSAAAENLPAALLFGLYWTTGALGSGGGRIRPLADRNELTSTPAFYKLNNTMRFCGSPDGDFEYIVAAFLKKILRYA